MNEIKSLIRKSEDYQVREEKLDPEEVLGDLASVEEISLIWSKYRENLKTIELSLLLDFCVSQKFSSEEILFYRKGLESMNIFIEKCFMAIKNKNEKNN